MPAYFEISNIFYYHSFKVHNFQKLLTTSLSRQPGYPSQKCSFFFYLFPVYLIQLRLYDCTYMVSHPSRQQRPRPVSTPGGGLTSLTPLRYLEICRRLKIERDDENNTQQPSSSSNYPGSPLNRLIFSFLANRGHFPALSDSAPVPDLREHFHKLFHNLPERAPSDGEPILSRIAAFPVRNTGKIYVL